jgi:hypothetical protein
MALATSAEGGKRVAPEKDKSENQVAHCSFVVPALLKFKTASLGMQGSLATIVKEKNKFPL